ncbi:MAG: SurA N-terminal domain-containing protein [Deltaproteobacteria bacterium]|nr:SurA N-terminal domain-containing protein [Deltaproteobacteria bacterium]
MKKNIIRAVRFGHVRLCGVSIFLFFMFFASAIARAEVVDRIVAVVNDSIITLSELNAAASSALDTIAGPEKKDAKKIIELKARILDGLIEQKLVKQAADKAGIEVSEREIDNAVEDVRRGNNMTQDRLLLALAQSGLTFRAYREQLKEQIRQVKFIGKEFRSKISVEDSEIEEYYRQNKDDFFSPASYRINLIFIPVGTKSADKVKAVEAGIAGGADFKGLATAYSQGAAVASGGDMGWLKPGEISNIIETAALKLKPGGTSGAVSAAEGTYFVKLVDIKTKQARTYEEVKESIRERLYKKAMEGRFGFWLTEWKKSAHIEIRL